MKLSLFDYLHSRRGLLTSAACAIAVSLQAQVEIDFEETNPFDGGTLSTAQAYSGEQSIYLGSGDRAAFAIPEELSGKDLYVSMMVYDMGKWIDRSVSGYPTASYGPRWGVSTGEHRNDQSIGISILERTAINSSLGYAVQGINGEGNDTPFANSWFSPTFFSGGRFAELTPGTGGSNDGSGWQPGPGGVGQWTEWTFFVSADGQKTSISAGGRTVTPHAIGGAITQVWLYGGRNHEASLPMGGVYVDDIRIWADADTSLVKVNTPPQIDGVLEDTWFASAPKYIANVTNGSVQDDADDLTATWHGLYDDSNFYLAINIRDEALDDTSASADWMRDSIEIYFNMDNVIPAGNARTGDNYQYVIRWNNLQAAVSGAGSLEGVEWQQSSSDDGWLVEIAFPWSTLFKNTPSGAVQQGYQFGFDIGVVDNDGGSNYDTIVFWNSTAGGLWSNMDSAGVVGLGPIFNGNYPPVLERLTMVQVTEIGQTLQFTVTATDLNEADTLTFSGGDLPDFVSVNKTGDDTATISVDAQEGDANTYVFTVTVSDGEHSDTIPVYLIVKNAGADEQEPFFEAVSPVNLEQGQSADVELLVTDIDSFTVDIALAAGSPNWVSVVDNGDKTATLKIAPVLSTPAGNYTITVQATDSEGLVGSVDVSVQVTEAQLPDAEWWKSYKSSAEGAVDTKSFLGEIWFDLSPWFYQSQTASWLYIDPGMVTVGEGAWIFSVSLTSGAASGAGTWEGHEVIENWASTGLGWLYIASAPFVYCDTLNTWFYLSQVSANGTWLYAFDLNDPMAEIAESWQVAWDSNDQEILDEWFEENTGFEALGLTVDDMWKLDSTVTITESWLTSNQGDHVFREKDRWVVYALRAPKIVINADNVTLRGCFVEMNFTNTQNGITGNGSNAIIEYCEVTNLSSAAPQSSKGIASIRDVTIRLNELYGLPFTAIQTTHNTVSEYNYVHSGVAGIKHVSTAIRGNNNHVRRNNLQTNSGSQTLGIYSHDELAPPTGLSNVLVEENLINGKEGHYGMMAGGEWNTQSQQATNIVVINNKFGVKFNERSGYSGAVYLWLGRAPAGQCVDDRGNKWAGNRWLTTGNLIRPVTNHSNTHPDDVYDDPCVD